MMMPSLKMPAAAVLVALLGSLGCTAASPMTRVTRIESPDRSEWWYFVEYHGSKLNALNRAREVCGSLAYVIVDHERIDGRTVTQAEGYTAVSNTRHGGQITIACRQAAEQRAATP